MTTTLAPRDVELPDLLGTAPADLIDQAADRPDATVTEARKRAVRIRTGLISYTQMRQDIADAYAHRDWAALGHESWSEYIELEFGEQLKRLAKDRDERQEAVRDLRGQGLSTRQIAAATGVDPKTVRNDLAEVGTDSAPATITGSDGKTYPATRPAKVVDEVPILDPDLVEGYRWIDADTNGYTLERMIGNADEFTHSCDRCKRRFIGEFPAWDGACGLCKWGTLNALPPHMGGLYPVPEGAEPLPVHYKVPGTVGAACGVGSVDGAQMTADLRAITCPACLNIDLDAPASFDPQGAYERDPADVDEPPTVDVWHCQTGGHVWPIVAGESNECPECGGRGGFTPAKPADTPGALVPGEADVPQPVDLGQVAEAEVDPGSVDDLLLLVKLYGDARAAATEVLIKSGANDEWTEHEQLAAQHLEQIRRSLGEQQLQQVEQVAAERPLPDTNGALPKLIKKLDQYGQAVLKGDPNRAATRRDEVLDLVTAMCMGVTPAPDTSEPLDEDEARARLVVRNEAEAERAFEAAKTASRPARQRRPRKPAEPAQAENTAT